MSLALPPNRPELAPASPSPARRLRLAAQSRLRVFARPALAIAPGTVAVMAAATQLPHGRLSMSAPGFVLCCAVALVFAGRNLIVATRESLLEHPRWPEAALEGFFSLALTGFGLAGLLWPFVGPTEHGLLLELLVLAKWSAVASNLAFAVLLAREIVARRPAA